MIAALPMYAHRENRQAHDVFWTLIRDHLRAAGVSAPEELDHEIAPMDSWARPDLVLGQICNLPYRALFKGRLSLIGVLDYGLPGAAPGHYYSDIVVRRDAPETDLDGALAGRLAFSESLSQSGWGALALWKGDDVRPCLETGGHLASLEAVAEGRADVASVDAVTLAMFERFEPVAAKVRRIARSPQSPGLTLATAAPDPAPHRAAIRAAIAELPNDIRQILGVTGLTSLPQTAYDLPLPTAPGLSGQPSS